MFIFIFLFLIGLLAFITITFYRLTYMQTASLNARLERIQYQVKTEEATKDNGDNADAVTKYLKGIINDFTRIGIDITMRELLTIMGIVYVIIFLLFFLLNKNFIASAAVACVGFFIPGLYVGAMITKRYKAFERLFGDAMTLIANTLRAGFSLKQALQLVATEMPSPIKDEFQILNHELDWGLPLEEALTNLVKRVPNEYVSLFVTAILIQSSVGGSLSDIVNKISETIATKQQLLGELSALTSQGKVSGTVVGIMPIGIGLMISGVNPDYIGTLFTTTLGIVLLVVAGFLEILGVVVIKAMIKLE